MDMNSLRMESHVAQKLRRHKLRFQQNSDDPTHQHLPQDSHLPVSYDPNALSPEMLNSINAMLHPHHTFIDQESCSNNNNNNNNNNSNGNSNNNSWSVGMMNMEQSYNIQELQNINDHKICSPYYQNGLQEVVTNTTGVTRVHQRNNLLEFNQLGFVNRNNNDHVTQGLSLSLSSVSSNLNLHSCPKTLKVEQVTCLDPKQLMGMASFAHRAMGPLGPFTGYATILKNSKYLTPAQELLSGSCDVGGGQACDNTHKVLEEEMSRVSGELGVLSSTMYGTNEDVAGRSSSFSDSYLPEFHQKKARLIYMEEEVCKRYKQYHQQMQMVVSSFETVAGLTSATPYVSLALKSVSRHFQFVKNAISEQLVQMKKTFEGLCSPSRTFDANNNTTDSLRSMEHGFQRHGKLSSDGIQHPVWRPQRGLPERAVSVLKAWLFDHFLHPYPSDADKHMLATQTGLTRNQVSNWFINARVRIWKPMVEEIHTLETKGLADSTSTKPLTDGQDTSRVNMGSMANKQQPECSRTSRASIMINSQNEPNEQLWDHEKRIAQATMDRSYANMMPYTRTTFEAGGVGPVSLTLGLWQNAEHVQQLQQHEHQFRQHFGGQLIHDFVG